MYADAFACLIGVTTVLFSLLSAPLTTTTTTTSTTTTTTTAKPTTTTTTTTTSLPTSPAETVGGEPNKFVDGNPDSDHGK